MRAVPGWLFALALLGCGDDGGSAGPADAAPDPDAAADAGSDATPPDGSVPDASPELGLTLQFTGPEHGLRVWLDYDGTIHPFDCDAQPETCPAAGFHLGGPPARVGAVAKAPGFRTQRAEIEADGPTRISLPLAPLPDFEVTDDYRTGFTAETGLADFQAMAFRSSGELGPVYVVKWYLEDPAGAANVWFQNTARHPVHYEFARSVLGRAYTPEEFEARTYHGADRPAMAGNLILYPEIEGAPMTVEFFPTDDLSPAQALNAYLALEERLGFRQSGGLYYLPAGSIQEAALLEDAGRSFDAAGAGHLKREALYAGLSMQLLNPGVSYGRLRVLTPEQLATEVVSYQDLIVLPRLPNELPLVGGTISAELQTPLAHVNVAAHARGTPNLALLGAETDPRVAPLVGKLVRFEVTGAGFTLAETTAEETAAFWRDRLDRPPFVPGADLTECGIVDLDDLGFADATRVGVKAANVAELHALLPGDAAPHGFAVTFACYEQFITTAVVTAEACDGAEADCLDEGRTAEICAGAKALCTPAADAGETLAAWRDRLLADETFRNESAIRESALDALRWVMRHVPLEDVDPGLAAALDAGVTERFGAGRVRMRSSTNAEDLANFSGAGLYSSTGATGSGDQAASREIRKVWASAWNWRAYEERGFWNIDQVAVKVGVLVHEAFEETVNGVLITANLADRGVPGFYVNAQQGNVPVTNPEDGALPEVFSIIPGPGGAQVARVRFSSLSPEAPLLSAAEIETLYRTALQVQRHFAPLYGVEPTEMALDIEWKVSGADRHLTFKQVRPYAD